MSLADELEALIAKSKVADDKGSSAKVLQDALEVMGFVATNLPAISAALHGRDAVLEEAALSCEQYRSEQVMSKYAKMSECQAARSAAEKCGKIIRALKEPGQQPTGEQP